MDGTRRGLRSSDAPVRYASAPDEIQEGLYEQPAELGLDQHHMPCDAMRCHVMPYYVIPPYVYATLRCAMLGYAICYVSYAMPCYVMGTSYIMEACLPGIRHDLCDHPASRSSESRAR